MNITTVIQADHAEQDSERRFLAACDLALANLRTPLQRYKKVASHPALLAQASTFMAMERAKDAMDVDRALHAEFVRPMPSLAGHPNALDFDAAERGRRISQRIAKFREQLSAKMEAEDVAFLADEPDYFSTARVSQGMV